MAYAKSSSRMHAARPVAKKSRRASARALDHRIFISARRAILSVIVLAVLVVLLSLISSSLSRPEHAVKSKIESIAADYYENYYYPDLVSFAPTASRLTEIMTPYVDLGFAKVTLRQLLLFNNGRYSSSAGSLLSYCDESLTYVIYYPKSPFGPRDYRADITYACAFD